ncbi:delta and Notch-like epidermal growth factor-related receptor, partial [Pocillopora damicornis]|uniref:delta and Notch-like epidermal growth factor-related receptor n=1 Tax=Pocillopora damicornis TaxID=46731 RepID=UPI000F54ED78
GKPLSRGTAEGIAYAKFEAHKFSYLNVTAIGSDYVGKGSECGFACCQNNGKCMALYEKNSYVCVCVKGYTGEHCET